MVDLSFFLFCMSYGVVPSRHIVGSVTCRALRTRLPSLRSVVPSRHRNEMGGTGCALARILRNALRAHPGEPDIPGAVRRRGGHTKTTKQGAEILRR